MVSDVLLFLTVFPNIAVAITALVWGLVYADEIDMDDLPYWFLPLLVHLMVIKLSRDRVNKFGVAFLCFLVTPFSLGWVIIATLIFVTVVTAYILWIGFEAIFKKKTK